MLELGIVGCGKVTTMFHLKAIDDVDEVTVGAVADLDPGRMEDVRKKSGAEKGYTDPGELLADPRVKAVAVNTPPRYHEELVLEALAAGKHVLCEKPLAQTVEGCERIKEAQVVSGLVVLPVHNYAFTPCLETALGVIDEGEIGEPEKIEVRFDNNLWSYGAKTRFRLEDEFSIVEDILPHVLSIIQPVAGPVESITEARGRKKKYEVLDDVELSMRTAGGAEVEAAVNWTSLIPALKVRIHGERGRIDMDLMKSPRSLTVKSPRGSRKMGGGLGQYIDLVQLKHPAFVGQYRHFVGAVEGREEPRFTVDDEIAMLKVMEEVVEILSESQRKGAIQ